jgi:phosphate starvation-inducible protein PhoH and related proteins
LARNIAKRAKRASKPNPREDRNHHLPSLLTAKRHDFHQPQDDAIGVEDSRQRRPKKRIELLPRNVAQEDYVDALMDESKHIVFAMGPAGTGKTMLGAQFALKGYVDGTFDKIIVTRPAVSVDEQHGFLPGTLLQKMEPWVMPILDVFTEHFSQQIVQKMMLDGVIEIAPLAYMRGRTFKNAIILADEMQNSTVSQTKMVLTRIGEGSRMIVTGDIKQHDRGYETNGLKDFVERLRACQSDAIAVVEFSAMDVERHPVIEEVLALYGE